MSKYKIRERELTESDWIQQLMESHKGCILDVTNQRLVNEIMALLFDEVEKRISIIDSIDDVEEFLEVLRGISFSIYECDEGIYDYEEERWITDHGDKKRDQEIVDHSLKMAALYVALIAYVKRKSTKRYER